MDKPFRPFFIYALSFIVTATIAFIIGSVTKDNKDQNDVCIVELYDNHTTMRHNGTICTCRMIRGGCYDYEMDCGRSYDWAIQALLSLSPMYYRGE